MSTITGPSDPDRLMWEMSLGEFLETTVDRNPAKVFIEIAGEEITYRQFQQRIEHTAGLFRDLGVSPGDRVCLFLPNCPEFLYCWFGLSLFGAISVPVNTAYKREEMAYILNDAGAKGLVTHESLLPVAEAAADLVPSIEIKLLVGSVPDADPSWR
ncbi:MAG: AMP-binding protein, partial [Dehalococcoidia bacterium]